MSEILAAEYCPQCRKDTIFIFVGSGTKGMCMECNYELDPEKICNFKRIVAHNL